MQTEFAMGSNMRDVGSENETLVADDPPTSRYESLFEFHPTPILEVEVLGENLLIKQANGAFKERFNFAGSAEGTRVTTAIPVVDSADERTCLRLVNSTGEPDTRMIDVDGSLDLDHLWRRAVPNPTEEMDTLFVTYQDHEVERYAQTSPVEQETAELKELSEILSHDLRNSLNTAQGWTKTIDNEAHADELERIESALDRIGTITETALSLTSDPDDNITGKEMLPFDGLLETCWKGVATGDSTLVVDDAFRVLCEPDKFKTLVEKLFRYATSSCDSAVTVRAGIHNRMATTTRSDGGGVEDAFYIMDERESDSPDGHSTATNSSLDVDDTRPEPGFESVRNIAEAHNWEMSIYNAGIGQRRIVFTNATLQGMIPKDQ